jgi:hypothetical protein
MVKGETEAYLGVREVSEMDACKRVKADGEHILSEQFLQLCKNAPTDFTRRRKMPCDKLIVSTLARKGRSMKIELRELGKVEGMEDISVAGYLKQREKLNPEALLELARFHASNLYASEDVMTYKGYLLLSIDGSSVNVPTTEETLLTYGNASGHGKPQAMCGISSVFDSLNRQIINTTITRGSFDERAEVPRHLETLSSVIGDRPFMFLMDRGYPSLALMSCLSDVEVPYVMRCSTSFLNKEFEEALEAGGDLEVSAALGNKRLSWLRKNNPEDYERLKVHEPIACRCVFVDIGTGVLERIVTNLPKEEFSAKDLKEIYHLRWNIETCFGTLKDKLQMENFSGTKQVLIEQDIFASMYILNLAYDLANEADKANRDKAARYKHEMTVNKSFAIGVVKEEIIHIILAPDEQKTQMLEALVCEIKDELVPVRKNRAYKRGNLKSGNSRHSITHKRVF